MADVGLLTCFPAILIAGGVLILASIRVVMEYERGVVFSFGKYARTATPGINFIIPIVESMQKLDTRVITIDIPKQEVMTKDNVPVNVNGVVYMRVENPEKAVLKIQDYHYAVSQYAQTALRDVVGSKEMDVVLSNRDEVADEIQAIVDKETSEWGIDITSIRLQDIELPADMKRAMARQAEAEREKRATIIMSTGEKAAAQNLADAANTLAKSQGALHLRTLQTLTDVASDEGNTLVFVAPIEMLEALKGLMGTFSKKKE